MATPTAKLANTIRRLRTAMGLTQEEFADRLPVSRRTLIRWEMGHEHPRPIARARLRGLQKEWDKEQQDSQEAEPRRSPERRTLRSDTASRDADAEPVPPARGVFPSMT